MAVKKKRAAPAKPTGRKIGRPTKYNDELQAKADEYAAGAWREAGHVIPSVEGLASVLDLSRETIYQWEKDPAKKSFSDTLGKISREQKLTLLNGGLSGEFNAAITKLALSHNHGFVEKTQTDNVSSDGSMSPPSSITLNGVRAAIDDQRDD